MAYSNTSAASSKYRKPDWHMSMTGTVITFYSYKGGVGRSFALANIAVLLGRWGFRVLCIDWDLEAPGLTHFFDTTTEDDQADSTSGHKALGLVELLEIFRTAKNDTMQWRDHAVPLHNQRTPNVSLLMAGHVDHTYTRRLHGLDWNDSMTWDWVMRSKLCSLNFAKSTTTFS